MILKMWLLYCPGLHREFNYYKLPQVSSFFIIFCNKKRNQFSYLLTLADNIGKPIYQSGFDTKTLNCECDV